MQVLCCVLSLFLLPIQNCENGKIIHSETFFLHKIPSNLSEVFIPIIVYLGINTKGSLLNIIS